MAVIRMRCLQIVAVLVMRSQPPSPTPPPKPLTPTPPTPLSSPLRASKLHPSPSGVMGLTRSAAAVIVGDEVLAAKVKDENGSVLCRLLRQLGWSVGRMAVLPDDVESIAKEVQGAMRQFAAVLVAGGIGPTMDDVTGEGVAKVRGWWKGIIATKCRN